MIYGDNPNKINEWEDALGLKTYTYAPSISSIMQSGNLYVYCGNNPISRIDPMGREWWHWALGATIVAGCAIATVIFCGGFAAAVTAVCMVGSGFTAATTASTIAAGTFIGSSTMYGLAVLSAAATSDSIEEFNEQGSWETVAVTAGGALIGGYYGYIVSKSQTSKISSEATSSSNTQNKFESSDSTPNIKYPGDDATKCNIPGFEWRGSGPRGSTAGNYYNMKTGEWLHPDLNHGPPIGPHWDYGVKGKPQVFRIFPDNTRTLK